jgi:hypothetical protein
MKNVLSKFDGLVKSRKCILSVIPAKAVVRRAVRQAHGPEQSRRTHYPEHSRRGIQCSQEVKNSWTPFFNGVTTFYEIVKFKLEIFNGITR